MDILPKLKGQRAMVNPQWRGSVKQGPPLETLTLWPREINLSSSHITAAIIPLELPQSVQNKAAEASAQSTRLYKRAVWHGHGKKTRVIHVSSQISIWTRTKKNKRSIFFIRINYPGSRLLLWKWAPDDFNWSGCGSKFGQKFAFSCCVFSQNSLKNFGTFGWKQDNWD